MIPKKYGWITDGVFKKRVDSKKHKMKILDAYGIEKSVVDELDAMDIKEIRIKEEDTGTVFITSYENFISHRFLKDFQTPQYFLCLKHFSKV